MKDKLVALLLRHGTTELNENGCFRAWLDIPLSPEGLAQAHLAAKFLSKFPIKRVMCSPLLRAFVTADIASAPHKLHVNQMRGLLPWNLGVFAGRPKKDAQAALKLFVDSPQTPIPAGESLEAFENRQFAFYEAVLKEQDALTLMVCHTSNVIALQNFTDDERIGEPEDAETVKPGGILAIYWDGKQHRAEPVFGKAEEAHFGGS